MPDHVPVRKLACPSCNAPISFDGPTTRCDYCGSVLERPRDDRQPVTTIYHATPVTPYVDPNRAVRRASGCALTTVLAVLIIGGGIAALAVTMFMVPMRTVTEEVVAPIVSALEAVTPRSAPVQAPRLYERQVQIATGAGAAAETLYGIAYDVSVSAQRIVALGGVPPRLLWQTAPLDISTTAPLVLDTATVYTADDTHLIALNRADGAERWRAGLSDAIAATICSGCIQPLGDSVVVLTSDGTVQGFDAATGGRRWSHTLAAEPRQLIPLGDRVGVLDDTEDGEVDVLLFAAADGSDAGRLSPRCPNEPFPSRPQGPGIYGRVGVDSAESALYIAAGFFEPGCVQRWDAAAGTLAWQTTLPVTFVRDGVPTVTVGDDLFVGQQGTVLALNRADGTLRTVVALDNDDYQLTPLGGSGDMLLVAALRQRGTRRHELWAFDSRSGARRWQVTPQATALAQDDLAGVAALAGGDGVWGWRATSRGVLLWQVRSDPARLVFETLNWQDGTSSGQMTAALGDIPGSLQLTVLPAQADNRLWVVVDGGLRLFDSDTAAELARWP